MHLFILIPLILIAAILLLFGMVIFLGRFKNGKYLRPIVTLLAKVPWLRKQLLKMNQAVIERQNPELASAMRKIQRVGPTADPKKLQQAYHSLSPEERRAYQEVVDQQGGAPGAREPADAPRAAADGPDEPRDVTPERRQQQEHRLEQQARQEALRLLSR